MENSATQQGSIYSDTSNYDMLNNSIFNTLTFTNTELEGGNLESNLGSNQSEFTQMSEFNVDKLFESENNEIFSPTSSYEQIKGIFSEGIFSPTASLKSSKNNASDIEKVFEQNMDKYSETSAFDVNELIGGDCGFSATSSCK